ncbi:MAG: hypothetical protein ABL973_21105 [Micropepsaceae bacterium]
MTLERTLALLRTILTDVPAAIATGAELIRLINNAYTRLQHSATHALSPEEISTLVEEIKSSSAQIQSIDPHT